MSKFTLDLFEAWFETQKAAERYPKSTISPFNSVVRAIKGLITDEEKADLDLMVDNFDDVLQRFQQQSGLKKKTFNIYKSQMLRLLRDFYTDHDQPARLPPPKPSRASKSSEPAPEPAPSEPAPESASLPGDTATRGRRASTNKAQKSKPRKSTTSPAASSGTGEKKGRRGRPSRATPATSSPSATPGPVEVPLAPAHHAAPQESGVVARHVIDLRPGLGLRLDLPRDMTDHEARVYLNLLSVLSPPLRALLSQIPPASRKLS